MTGITEFNPVDHVRLVQEKTSTIKRLSGFRKHHRVPEFGGSSDLQFLSEISSPEMDADLQAVFSSLRSAFELKRRQLTVTGPEFRCGVIGTPYFNYEISVELQDGNPGSVLWRRAITGIRDPNQVFGDPFYAVFGNRFSILEISSRDPFEIEAIIDQIEDSSSSTVTVDYDKDLTWCEIRFDPSEATVKITEKVIRIVSQRDVSPRELLESFLKVQRQFITRLTVEHSPFLDNRQRAV